MENCTDEGGGVGLLLSLDSTAHKSVPAAFLTKTYQIVDDPATNHVVSWGDDDSTFIVWHPPEFALVLQLPLPAQHLLRVFYGVGFRCLFYLGFRKIVTDRWEFANDFFRKGEKSVLYEIHSRKAAHSPLPLPQPALASGPRFFPYSGRASISPASESDDNQPTTSWCDSPPLVSSPLGAASTNGGSKSCLIGYSDNLAAALSEDNERLRGSNNMLIEILGGLG
ncbi:hypothetical protein MLD38_024735 [Melastoma candidum]|uniref:Uncharacterized protein n=1 Tax=Melastoma candidum TaxID=119954 RepID=A0ACB9NTA6_9MYRT|nr:hypothetical protein MLD38_024735 [Melastoma candidum]